MSIVAADPGQILVNSAAEKAMPTRLFHDDRAQILVVDMELVAFPTREDHA